MTPIASCTPSCTQWPHVRRALPARCAGTLHARLQLAQLLLGLGSCLLGLWILLAPLSHLAGVMSWAGDYLEGLVRVMGAINLVGGLGLLLPMWTLGLLQRVGPELSVAAAAGCMALQVASISFHLARGETHELVLNLVLLCACLFVLWGRVWKAPRLAC